MSYQTGIRLFCVAQNPANGFPARLLGGLGQNPRPRMSAPLRWGPVAGCGFYLPCWCVVQMILSIAHWSRIVLLSSGLSDCRFRGSGVLSAPCSIFRSFYLGCSFCASGFWNIGCEGLGLGPACLAAPSGRLVAVCRLPAAERKGVAMAGLRPALTWGARFSGSGMFPSGPCSTEATRRHRHCQGGQHDCCFHRFPLPAMFCRG